MPTSTLPHLEVSQALLDEISARADEGERAGNLPLDLVEAMRDAGIFRMMQPTALGGFEIHPAELISIVERLSHADGSTGWIGSIGAGGPAFTAWLDPAVARDMLGPNADLSIATVFAPTGQLRPRRRGRARPVGSVAVRERMPSCALVLHGSVRVRRRCAPFHRGRSRLAARALPERPGRDHRQLGRARHARRRGATTSRPTTCGCPTSFSSDPSSSRLVTTVLSGA